jgi:hypothetical protein
VRGRSKRQQRRISVQKHRAKKAGQKAPRRQMVHRGLAVDCRWGEIRRHLEYKAAMRGGRIVVANRFYRPTQICSCCGSITGLKGRQELHVERCVCSAGGAEHGRDDNAAIVLKKLALASAEPSTGTRHLYRYTQMHPQMHL